MTAPTIADTLEWLRALDRAGFFHAEGDRPHLDTIFATLELVPAMLAVIEAARPLQVNYSPYAERAAVAKLRAALAALPPAPEETT